MNERKLPTRRCVGCMQTHPKKDLVRIVSTDKGLLLDPSGKMPGRGCYLCKNMDCMMLARKRNSIGKNLKISVSTEEMQDLTVQFEKLIQQVSTREVFECQTTTGQRQRRRS